jgi:hypothetical protein
MASHAHDDHEPTTTGPKVLATSTVSPKVRTIAVVRPAAHDVTYLAATKTGLGITLKHFAKNLFGRRRTVEQLNKGEHPVPTTAFDKVLSVVSPVNDIETIQYPEEKVGLPRAVPRPAPAPAARRRPGALRGLHVLPDGVPGQLHHDHPRAERRQGHREAAGGLRDRRAALRGVWAVRRGLPVRRDPDGLRHPRQARRGARRRGHDQGQADRGVGKDNGKSPTSIATQGGAGANWRDGR